MAHPAHTSSIQIGFRRVVLMAAALVVIACALHFMAPAPSSQSNQVTSTTGENGGKRRPRDVQQTVYEPPAAGLEPAIENPLVGNPPIEPAVAPGASVGQPWSSATQVASAGAPSASSDNSHSLHRDARHNLSHQYAAGQGGHIGRSPEGAASQGSPNPYRAAYPGTVSHPSWAYRAGPPYRPGYANAVYYPAWHPAARRQLAAQRAAWYRARFQQGRAYGGGRIAPIRSAPMAVRTGSAGGGRR